jgi:hypothetical protein
MTGPLRIRVGADGAPAMVGRSGQAPNRPPTAASAGKAPAAQKEKLALSPKGPGPGKAEGDANRGEVGNDTGKWMAGQLPGNALSWSDDDAGRRAVMTRNQGQGLARPGPVSPPPAAAAPGPPPQLQPPPQPMPQMQPGYGYPAQPGLPPGMVPVGYPMQAAAPRNYTAWLAAALALVVVLGGLAVALFSKALWPTVKLECDPPGASVLVDGKTLGVKAPLEVKLKPYTAHRIEFQAEGYKPRALEKAVELGYLASGDFAVTLEKKRHSVHVSPVAAEVFVNERLVGKNTDLDLPDLDPRLPVTIRVQAEGYRQYNLAFKTTAEMPESVDVPLVKN